MSKVFYDKPIIEQIFEEFEKDEGELLNLVERLPPEDVNVQDNYGDTVLILVSTYGYTGTVKLLLEKDGIDINIHDFFGNIALTFASRKNHAEIVKLLLEKGGMDINTRYNSGNTALVYAKKYGHTEIVQLLEDYQKN